MVRKWKWSSLTVATVFLLSCGAASMSVAHRSVKDRPDRTEEL